MHEDSSREAIPDSTGPEADLDTAPPADKRLLFIAGTLLAIPIIAMLWVDSYARDEPRLGGFPFFFWYQLAWVFLCAGLTYTAHKLVLRARPRRPIPGPITEERDGKNDDSD
ncbi:MAG TPA: DUF3311 domain-containing protein [Acidobacteriaceae bacterium]|nr:DUF3311 domain-containing protein [Acidobacteriaceae bacterium]